MLPLLCYFSAAGIALTWCVRDANAAGCFEVLRPQLHATARDMGAYREWLIYSLPRFIVLFTLIGLSALIAYWFLLQNPFGLRTTSRSIAFGAMSAGAIGLLSLPHLVAKVRFKTFLRSKAAELSKLTSLLAAEERFPQNFEPAGYRTEADWTAWHPNQANWENDPLWTGVVPVVYLRREPTFSWVVPVDWTHFLAWNLPVSSLSRGRCLPMLGPHTTAFTIEAAYELRSRPNWSVIRVDLKFGPELRGLSSATCPST